jgi:hypothetical protein
VEITVAGGREALGAQMMDKVQDQITHIELLPDLSHCVETRAKQEHAAAMSRIMSGDSSPELGQRLELLKAFLEKADFGRLRIESEAHLVQGRKVMFILLGSVDPGGWSLEMAVED